MATLIVGPTCSGKSTLVNSPSLAEFGVDSQAIIFPDQLSYKTIQPHSCIHYNLLHGIFKFGACWQNWEFPDEPIFKQILNSNKVQNAIVLVSPIQELRQRIKTRKIIEAHNPTPYPNQFWLKCLEKINIFYLYEKFLGTLNTLGISYKVIFSSSQNSADNFHPEFRETDRVYIHKNLRGQYVKCPARQEVESFANNPNFHYQSVLLPYGISTCPQNYEHVKQGRHLTFEMLLPETLQGESVLDIGTALGDLLFHAERLGASDLVGLEPNRVRFEAAKRLKKFLHSEVELINRDFLALEDERTFDHVYVLNVIHHVTDFYEFLYKAASRSRKTLNIEFPTLTDTKFLRFWQLSRQQVNELNKLPIFGMSSLKQADQTFVYSPVAMEQLIMSEIGGFEHHRILHSPIKDRIIMTFYKGQGTASTPTHQPAKHKSRLTDDGGYIYF